MGLLLLYLICILIITIYIFIGFVVYIILKSINFIDDQYIESQGNTDIAILLWPAVLIVVTADGLLSLIKKFINKFSSPNYIFDYIKLFEILLAGILVAIVSILPKNICSNLLYSYRILNSNYKNPKSE